MDRVRLVWIVWSVGLLSGWDASGDFVEDSVDGFSPLANGQAHLQVIAKGIQERIAQGLEFYHGGRLCTSLEVVI